MSRTLNDSQAPLKTINRLRTSLVSVVMIIIGLIIQWIASFDGSLQIFLNNVASFFLTSGVLSLVWDYYLKKSITDELLSRIGLAKSVHDVGIEDVTFDPRNTNGGIDWDRLFLKTIHLDIFFTHAIQWSIENESNINDLLSRSKAKIRVLLPDGQNDMVIRSIIASTGKNKDRLISDIDETAKRFTRLSRKFGHSLEVRVIDLAPSYTIYRFDKEAVISMKSCEHRKVKVPHFVVMREGTFYEFIESEFDSMWNRAKPYEQKDQ